jgi:hypothetical protein
VTLASQGLLHGGGGSCRNYNKNWPSLTLLDKRSIIYDDTEYDVKINVYS